MDKTETDCIWVIDVFQVYGKSSGLKSLFAKNHLVCDVTIILSMAILTVTSPIVINVPTRDLLAVETKVLLSCGWQNLNTKIIV